jgi:hypothetical protein
MTPKGICEFIAVRLETIEAQLRALESENATMQELMNLTELCVVHLAIAWQQAGITERQEIQSRLLPEGLR